MQEKRTESLQLVIEDQTVLVDSMSSELLAKNGIKIVFKGCHVSDFFILEKSAARPHKRGAVVFLNSKY